MAAEQHHNGLELPNRLRLHRSVQQYSTLRQGRCGNLNDMKHEGCAQNPYMLQSSNIHTLRALTGEVPSSDDHALW
jgi:hypothetical protein